MPAAGEKLVCLRNDKTKGLLNGGTWTIKALRASPDRHVRLDVVPEGESRRRPVEVSVLRAFFEGTEGALSLLERRSEEHTSEIQSRQYLVCRLLLEKKKNHVSH